MKPWQKYSFTFLLVICLGGFLYIAFINQNKDSITTNKPKPSPNIKANKEIKKDIVVTKEELEKLTDHQKKVLNKFLTQRQELLREIPLKTDMQRLEEGQVHLINQELIETGRKISRLKSIILKYPELSLLQKEGKQFYEDCADNDQFPTAIRSLCLFSRVQLAKNNKEIFDISQYPLEIKRLVLEMGPFGG